MKGKTVVKKEKENKAVRRAVKVVKPEPKNKAGLPITLRTSEGEARASEHKEGGIRNSRGRTMFDAMAEGKPLDNVRPAEVLPVKVEPAPMVNLSIIDRIRTSNEVAQLLTASTDVVRRSNQFLSKVGQEGEMTLPLTEEGVRLVRAIMTINTGSEDTRKLITKPLLDAKKQVDQIFKSVTPIGDMEDQIRLKLVEAADTLKQTTRFPGVGLLVIKPHPEIVLLSIDAVPPEYTQLTLRQDKILDAVTAGVEEIPGIIITPRYSIEIRADKAVTDQD
jgi:hypothetical protein